MRPLVPALALLSSFAGALERAVETFTEGPRLTVPVTPSLTLPLTPAAGLGPTVQAASFVPLAGASGAKVPAASASAVAAARGAALTTPAPLPALPAAAALEKRAGLLALDGGKDSSAPSDGGEDWLSGSLRFDGGARRSALDAVLTGAWASPYFEAYRSAVEAAEKADWADRGAAVADAGLALWTSQGVKAARTAVKVGHERPPGVVVEAVRGASPLNDLAFDLKARLGATLALVPRADAGTLGAFVGVDNLILLTRLDGPHVHSTALHEARHAWYSSLLRRGEIRLFHMKIQARPGLDVRKGALTYTDALSLEELSTFPKTVKHLLLARAKAPPQEADLLAKTLRMRLRQVADMLKTTEDIAGRIASLEAHGKLDPVRLTEAQARALFLEPVDGMAWHELPLARTRLFFPVPIREKRVLGFKTRSSSAKEARAALLARSAALRSLLEALVPHVVSAFESVEAEDWDRASTASGKMISAVAAAEAAWALASPHGKVPGNPGS